MDTIDSKTKWSVTRIDTPRKTTTKTTTWDPSPDGDRILVSLDILWAPGHVALTGVRVLYNDFAILPWGQPSGQLVGDNERRKFGLGLYISKPLVIVTSNGDGVPHSHYFTAELIEVPVGGPLTPYTPPVVVV